MDTRKARRLYPGMSCVCSSAYGFGVLRSRVWNQDLGSVRATAYAIFFVIIYLESLLRDRVFTVRTDHLNLLFITQASNPMIVPWYMALSEFSFKIEFIKGVDNGIADSSLSQWHA